MHHTGWRLCQYLPFYHNGRHATGMTVYLSPIGITGIVVHGEDFVHRAGIRQKFTMYTHFDHGERVVGLDLVGADDTLGVFLLLEIEVKPENDAIMENATRRCFFFGPAGLLYPCNDSARWLSLLPSQADGERSALRGLIVDPMALHRDFEPWQESKGYRTIADLLNVKELAIQKIPQIEDSRHRCIGLFIRYSDGSSAVLGQWDVSASSTNLYYATKGKPLTSLLFQNDPNPNRYEEVYMADIITNTLREAYYT
ncbi:hypothetical protein J3F83DRAFT_754692 [Trichoderma novae-zelandiae]